MRRPLVALAVACAMLVGVPAAEAAMCIKLTAQPTRPQVGVRTTVVIRTFVQLEDGSLEPWDVRSYPFRLEAVSPTGAIHRIRVRHGDADPYRWVGSFRFSQRGMWTLRVTNFAPYLKDCGEVLRLRVARR